MIRNLSFLLIFAGLLVSCTDAQKREDLSEEINNPSKKVILSSEIVWEKLNPLMGDQSPQVATIWGDRNGTEATGFLAKYAYGFSSPTQINNFKYRAVVIDGLVHNDDPDAEKMWMGQSSFWTQAPGESHITSAKGNLNIALVEIDNGPYLVKSTDNKFDNGERSINIDASNIVWLNKDQTNWIAPNSNAEISFLSESKIEKGLKSLFAKFPAGYEGQIKSTGKVLHSVIIKGALNYSLNKEDKRLDSGSYFGSSDRAIHEIATEDEVILYIRTDGGIELR